MSRLALLLCLVACAGGADDSYPPELPLPDDYRTCSVDEDCVVVELGLCDHCNGGLAVAVSADQADRAIEDFGESEKGQPKNWACTTMGCAPVGVACEESLCVEVELGMYGTELP